MKKLLLIPLLFVLPAIAQTPLRSVTWGANPIQCGTSPTAGGADLMPLDSNNNWETQNAIPGAQSQSPNTWAQDGAGRNITVRKVCVAHYGTFTNGYAVVGHSGPNGDHVSPYLIGKGQACMEFPADAPVVVTGGEYFDVHAGCESGSHAVTLQIWYTRP